MIVSYNRKCYGKSAETIMKQNQPITLKLYNAKGLVKCNWFIKNKLTKSNSDSCRVQINNKGNIKIVVKDSLNYELSQFTLNIYDEKPEFKWRKVNESAYTGEYGFDNFYDTYPVLKTNANYYTLQVNGKTVYVPWLTAMKSEPVTVKIKIDNITNFKKDSTAYLRFISPTSITTVLNNGRTDNKLTAKDLLTAQEYELKITANTTEIFNNRFVYIIDQINDTIGKIAVVCKENTPKNLRVIYIKDPKVRRTNNMNITTLQTFLNNNSYNQVFINWTVQHFPASDTLVVPDSISKIIRRSGDPTVAYTELTALFQNKTGINVKGPTIGTDFYLFLTSYNLSSPTTNKWKGFAKRGTSTGVFLTDLGNEPIAAHELGHCFGLLHVDEEYSLDMENGPKNYMSYNRLGITFFWFHQWRRINTQFVK
jgi:hypothetical protein